MCNKSFSRQIFVNCFQPKSSGWHDNDRDKPPYQLSIWNPQYRPMAPEAFKSLLAKKSDAVLNGTRGKETVARIPQPMRRQHTDNFIRADTGAYVCNEIKCTV